MTISIVMSSFIFYCGVLVLSSYNAIYALLFLIILFSMCSIVLIWLHLEFLALILMIIYIGAIALLFLFIIMMLNIRIAELSESLIYYFPLGGLVVILLAWTCFITFSSTVINEPISVSINWFSNYCFCWVLLGEKSYIGNLVILGQMLYTFYGIFLMVACILLLVGMIGSVSLCIYMNKSLYQARKQDLYSQISSISSILLLWSK